MNDSVHHHHPPVPHYHHHVHGDDDDDDHHGAAELLHDDLVEGKFPHSREGSGRALPEDIRCNHQGVGEDEQS